MYSNFSSKYNGENAKAYTINNLVILAPNLNEYTVDLFKNSIRELFPGNRISSHLIENFDDRWIDGTISRTDDIGPGKSKVRMDGGNDHDSGVASTTCLEIIVKDPYEDKGLCITFVACPVVSTQIGYNALLSSELIELGHDFEGELPYGSAYKAIKYFNAINNRVLVHDVPLNGEAQDIELFKRPLAIGDLSLVANRLQQEFISFFRLGGQSNFDLMFDTSYNSLPALARKVFSPYNYQVDVANLYRCHEFFMRNELPGIVQNIANKTAEKSTDGKPCCSTHNDDRISISCSDYKIRTAIRSALDFKTHQMFDGYRTGTSLLKAMFMFHTPSTSMEYAIDIRAELVRIACRNMHDLYSKGYYTRLGASQAFFYDNYVVDHGDLPTIVSYISNETTEMLKLASVTTEVNTADKAIASKAISTAVASTVDGSTPVPDAMASYDPMHPQEYQFDIHGGTKTMNVKYGYEFIMNSFYVELLRQLGPNFKVLKDVVIAY